MSDFDDRLKKAKQAAALRAQQAARDELNRKRDLQAFENFLRTRLPKLMKQIKKMAKEIAKKSDLKAKKVNNKSEHWRDQFKARRLKGVSIGDGDKSVGLLGVNTLGGHFQSVYFSRGQGDLHTSADYDWSYFRDHNDQEFLEAAKTWLEKAVIEYISEQKV